tara:strand:+ start:13028 stop:13477 length:450 start_codon:yes stop_codon:yes gene_type:complete
MRSIILALALMASLSGCVTKRVQDRTLVPAIEAAWPGVRADAELGGADAALLLDGDASVESGNYIGLNVLGLEAAAIVGVDLRLIAGEIGVQGAAIMRDRAAEFRRAVQELTRVVLVSHRPIMRDRPIVISRSSWATHPPAAIAARTYR